jgi:RNA polymerase primary sigma factor
MIPEELIKKNTGIVVQIAKHYSGLGVPMEDLVQEGYIGIMRAHETWDPEKSQFITYASMWIRQKIRRAVEMQSRNVRLPINIQRVRYQANRYITRRELLTGETPTVEEALSEIDSSIPTGDAAMEACSYSFKEVHGSSPVPGPDRPDLTIVDMISVEAEEYSDTEEVISAVISTLTERQQKVLRMRFWEGKTLQQVADWFGFSREYARQVEVLAIKAARRAIAVMEGEIETWEKQTEK